MRAGWVWGEMKEGPRRRERPSGAHATRSGRGVRAHHRGGAVLGHAGVVEVVGVAGLDDAHTQDRILTPRLKPP